jgi:YjbE family integral membrane protein
MRGAHAACGKRAGHLMRGKAVGSLAQYTSPDFWNGAFHDSWANVGQPRFWVAVVQIIWINILLSGDNAVVIAMACRGLPPRQRLWGLVIGAGVASVLLIAFTGIVATLMTLPFLKLVGGCALFWVAYNLLVPDAEDDNKIEAVETLWRAVRIVVIADIVMSLDNVIAVAAAANGNYALLVMGLAISIPLVIAGSAAIMAILEKFPILIWAGAALLGWIAGGLMASDPFLSQYASSAAKVAVDAVDAILGHPDFITLDFEPKLVEFAFSLLGAIGVVIAGSLTLRSRRSLEAHATKD